MKGLGLSPIGRSLFGSGTVDQTSGIPSVLYPGGQAESFTLNKDWQVDGYGRVLGWSIVKTKVYLALFTVQGSSAVPNFGLAPLPLVITDTTATEVRAAILNTLDRMIKAKEIQVDDIEVITSGNRLAVNLFFTDLKTRTQESLSLPSLHT